MIIGGMIMTLIFLFFVALPPHPRPGTTTTAADWRFLLFICAYLTGTTAVVGTGLKRQISWAWDGTIYLSYLLTFIGLLLPLMVLGAKSHQPSGVVGAGIIAALFLAPVLLFVRRLFRRDVREVFRPKPLLDGRSPTFWIRMIAIGSIIGSGFQFGEMLNPSQRPLFGIMTNGIAQGAYDLAMGILFVFVGRGLYRLNDSTRKLGIALTAFGTVQYWTSTVLGHDGFKPTRIFALTLSTILVVATIWYLQARREIFLKPQS